MLTPDARATDRTRGLAVDSVPSLAVAPDAGTFASPINARCSGMGGIIVRITVGPDYSRVDSGPVASAKSTYAARAYACHPILLLACSDYAPARSSMANAKDSVAGGCVLSDHRCNASLI